MANALVDIKKQLAAELANVAKTVSAPSGRTISTKGKQFTLPDGSTNPGPMDAIILDWRTAHTYYKGAYNPQKPEPPACFAIAATHDGMAPSPNSPEQQADDCASCPMNQWGSAPQGKGKACKNSRRLAIIPANFHEDDDVEPMILTVSPMGIKNFDGYVNKLRTAMGVLPLQVSTGIGFDPAQAYPLLVFGSPKAIDEDHLPAILKLRDQAQDLLDKEPDVTRS